MRRTHWILTLLCGACLLGWVAGTPAAAQERREDLDERIRERFASMLRSELALSDDQAETVLPAMAELEQYKRELGRQRRETVHALQTGMRDGASDAELQGLLDRFEQINDDQRLAEHGAMAKIDADLNTRQRVKLRFFVQRFRREIGERLSNRAERKDLYRMRQEGPRRPDRR